MLGSSCAIVPVAAAWCLGCVELSNDLCGCNITMGLWHDMFLAYVLLFLQREGLTCLPLSAVHGMVTINMSPCAFVKCLFFHWHWFLRSFITRVFIQAPLCSASICCIRISYPRICQTHHRLYPIRTVVPSQAQQPDPHSTPARSQ